jgi:hypothetical protein
MFLFIANNETHRTNMLADALKENTNPDLDFNNINSVFAYLVGV